MSENTQEPIIKETFFYKKHIQVLVTILGVIAIVGVGVYVMLAKMKQVSLTAVDEAGEPAVVTEMVGTDDADKINAILAQDFTFVILPDALMHITVAPPEETVDTTDFKTKNAALTPEQKSAIPNDTLDTAFYIEGQPYYSYLNNRVDATPAFQLHDEVNELVKYFNQQYKQQTLTARSGEIVAENQNDESAALLVYPSKRVAEGYVAAAIATALNPDNAELYQKIATDYAERGVAYGWYGESDVLISKKMVDQYMATDEVKAVLASLQDS